MIDISSVLEQIVLSIGARVYPEGENSVSTTGAPTRIYPGWPDAKNLDEDLAKGYINISVFPRAGIGQTTTRYDNRWTYDPVLPTPTLTAEVIGRTVKFSGVGSKGLLAGIIEGGQSWPLKVMEGWRPEQVASAFRSIVRPGVILNGASLTFPGSERLVARTAAAVPEEREVRRQTRGVQISVWAPSSALRDKAFQIVDLWVATTPFFQVEGRAVRLTYEGDSFDDDARQANLHRRDLYVTVEYPTIDTRSSPPVVIPQVNIVVNPGGQVIRTIYP